ncbi:hypothetical protein Tco_1388033 [Tanacetum coccineum]
MSWRRIILALGLHTAEEMAIDGFGDYWTDNLREIASKADLRDYCISGRGQAPEKVTATDLFYLKSIDEGTVVNIPYLLAQYLFRHAEGRKQGARMSSGYFVARLAEHFGLITEESLRGLIVVAPGLERHQVIATKAAQADQKIPNEGVQADPIPVQAPSAAPAPRNMP